LATYNTGDWFPQPLLADLNKDPKLKAEVVASSGGVRNAKPAPGRFPLVLFSHGWAGFRDQSSLLTSHLASWGFVVASPDHPSDDLTEVIGSYLNIPPPTTDKYADVQDLLATVQYLQTGAPTLLSGHVDASRFVVFGHSAGGVDAENLASLETASSQTNDSVNPLVGFIGLAGASTAGLSPPLPAPYNTVPDEPSIFVMAQNDRVVPGFYMEQTYNALVAPHRLIILSQSGHLVFSDTCITSPGEGALEVLLSGLKIPIPSSFLTGISDGCAPPDLPASELQPVLNQIVVAGVRNMFGIDRTQAGLTNLNTTSRKLVSLNITTAFKS
jgi:dienelactone hydrolase